MPHTAIARSSGFFFLFFLGSSTERNELPLDPPVVPTERARTLRLRDSLPPHFLLPSTPLRLYKRRLIDALSAQSADGTCRILPFVSCCVVFLV